MAIIGNSKASKKRGLNIVVVGCGKVGSALISQLDKEGHTITVVDKKPERVAEITNSHDIMGIVGNGASYSILMEANASVCDLIIAVTESDELNLLCCTIAKKLSNCAAIARVRTPDYSMESQYLIEKLGLVMVINPELLAANEMARILYLPTALEVNLFAEEHIELIKFKIPEGNILADKAIKDVGSDLTNKETLICVVERGGEIFIPYGDFILRANDTISFASTKKSAVDFLNKVGFNTKQVEDTIIVGGGTDAYYLASLLLSKGISVKIIERDRDRCEELSMLLPKAVIINGDGTDENLLMEEGIEESESFIPLTGIDEENVVLTLYAKQVSKAKVVTKIDRTNFRQVINMLDLGSIIFPQTLTCEKIVAYARAKQNSMGCEIETLYHMFDNRVEAIEFKIDKESSVTGVPLMDMKLKKNLLICFIKRGENIITPGGSDCIMPGDTVMVVTTNTGFNDIGDILQ